MPLISAFRVPRRGIHGRFLPLMPLMTRVLFPHCSFRRYLNPQSKYTPEFGLNTRAPVELRSGSGHKQYVCLENRVLVGTTRLSLICHPKRAKSPTRHPVELPAVRAPRGVIAFAEEEKGRGLSYKRESITIVLLGLAGRSVRLLLRSYLPRLLPPHPQIFMATVNSGSKWLPLAFSILLPAISGQVRAFL